MVGLVGGGGWDEVDGCLMVGKAKRCKSVLANGGMGEKGCCDGIKVAIAQ